MLQMFIKLRDHLVEFPLTTDVAEQVPTNFVATTSLRGAELLELVELVAVAEDAGVVEELLMLAVLLPGAAELELAEVPEESVAEELPAAVSAGAGASFAFSMASLHLGSSSHWAMAVLTSPFMPSGLNCP